MGERPDRVNQQGVETAMRSRPWGTTPLMPKADVFEAMAKASRRAALEAGMRPNDITDTIREAHSSRKRARR